MATNIADPVSVEALASEVERYLATVEYFRSEGCEPRWSGEAEQREQPTSSARRLYS
jgi:hypothetical protein